MVTSWRVTHSMGLSVKATILSGCLLFTTLFALVAVVPPALVIEERHEVRHTAEGLQFTWGGSTELFAALLWGAIALLALPWAWVVRWTGGALSELVRDLFGAEQTIEGVIEKLTVSGTRKHPSHNVFIAGQAWSVPSNVYRTLRPGMLVRLTTTRFNDLVIDLALPVGAPPGPAQP